MPKSDTRLRYVESLNQALVEALEADANVVVLGEDIIDPYGGAFKVTRGLSTRFPGRVITTPISEGALVGAVTGMAIRGLRPVLEIMFGDFLTLCADQIVNGATKFRWMYNDQVEVPIVIRTPMGGRRGYGPTHSQSLEQLFMGVTGLTILAPSNFHDAGAILKGAILNSTEPTLFIENKLLYSGYLQLPGSNDGEFDVYVLQTGDDDMYPTVKLVTVPDEPADVTLAVYGGMAPLAATAAVNVVLEEEIKIEVIIPSRIKPHPISAILNSVRTTGRLVVAEEGVRTAGWGAEIASEVSELLFRDLKAPVVRIGAKESPIPSARPLEDAVLPQVGDIEDAIYRIVNWAR